MELAKNLGKDCELVPDPEDYIFPSEPRAQSPELIIGISSGASAPEFLVDALVAKLADADTVIERLQFKEEIIVFPLPKELAF